MYGSNRLHQNCLLMSSSSKACPLYVTNIDGPLKYLENKWNFTQKKNVTEVYFEVDFELKNKFLNIGLKFSVKKSFHFFKA